MKEHLDASTKPEKGDLIEYFLGPKTLEATTPTLYNDVQISATKEDNKKLAAKDFKITGLPDEWVDYGRESKPLLIRLQQGYQDCQRSD